MSKEVVTIQAGHYSNYVGTHWWNIQESSFVYDPRVLKEFPKEVDHDVLFREGKTRRGETTFTPRLVMIDLANSLGSLKKEGTLYDINDEAEVRWADDVTLHESEPARKSKFLRDLEEAEAENDLKDITDEEKSETEADTERKEKRMDRAVAASSSYQFDDILVWSDFLHTSLHPKSVLTIPGYQHNNPQQPFGIFGEGKEAISGSIWDELENRVRYFVEECDQLQGFQVLFDNYNAFGGVTSSILNYLSDEFSNKPKFTFSLAPTSPPDETALQRSSRILNNTLSLYNCGENSSLYVPLSLASSLWRKVGSPLSMPYLRYETKDYHSSAIIAATLDTATLPYRQDAGQFKITDITSSFSSYGRKIASLSSSLPFPTKKDEYFIESLMNFQEDDPWTSLTPNVSSNVQPFFQSCVARGMQNPKDVLRKSKKTANINPEVQKFATLSNEEILRKFLTDSFSGCYNSGCVMRDKLKTSVPFPDLFKENVDFDGCISEKQRSPNLRVESVPMMTSLQSSDSIFSYVDSLHGCVSRFNLSKHPHFISAGLDEDEFLEAVHSLRDLAQNYSSM